MCRCYKSQVLQDIIGNSIGYTAKKEGQKIYSLLAAMLLYLPGQGSPKKASPEVEEEEEESALEVELEESVEMQEDDPTTVRYLPLEENLLEEFSDDEMAAPDALYDGITSLTYYEEGYVSPAADGDDAETGIALREEVLEELEESKYDFIVTSVDVDFKQQEKIATLILFNSAEYTLLEYINNWDRDVNYRSAV